MVKASAMAGRGDMAAPSGGGRRGDFWSMKSWSDSLLSQIKTTYRGSKDDIGWLQREEGLPPVRDQSERFLQILARICRGVHTLPESLAYILVPGTTYWLPQGMQTGPYRSLYFVATEKYLRRLGLTCKIAQLDHERPMEANAGALADLICDTYATTGKRVALLAHSTGGVVATSALALRCRQLADCVAGVVVMQCPYAGSAVVSDAMRSAEPGGARVLAGVLQLALAKFFKGSLQSLKSLTYASRRQFLRDHPFPSSIPVVSFHTEAPKSSSLLSRVHHAEVSVNDLPPNATSLLPPEATFLLPPPKATATSATHTLPLNANMGEETTEIVEPPLETAIGEEETMEIADANNKAKRVGVSFPVAATLAGIAWQLELWYGAKNDGFVLRADAEVPGSVVVRPHKRADHSWLVFGGSESRDSGMPAPSQVAEALLSLLLEAIDGSA